MSIKQLKIALSQLKVFEQPKIQLEQYATSIDIVIECLLIIGEHINLSESIMIDLGAGTGMLSIAASLFETQFIYSYEIDSEAIKIFQENQSSQQINNIEIIQQDLSRQIINREIGDFVFMNPPFGTKCNQPLIECFIQQALSMTKGPIYILHKENFNQIEKIVHKFNQNKVVEIVQSFDYEINQLDFNWEDLKDFKKKINQNMPNKYRIKQFHKQDKKTVKLALFKIQDN